MYGWYEWLFGGTNRTALHVTRVTARQWAIATPVFLAFGLGLGWYLAHHTDSPVPYLDALLTSGQDPVALMGAIHWSLRRFAMASRIIRQADRQGRACSVSNALTQAGIRSWQGALEQAERQLVQLGRERSRKLYRWLLEVDTALKSTHSTPDRARLMLEQLITRVLELDMAEVHAAVEAQRDEG